MKVESGPLDLRLDPVAQELRAAKEHLTDSCNIVSRDYGYALRDAIERYVTARLDYERDKKY